MWKMQKSTNLLTQLIVTLIFIAQFTDTALALSDKRLCADEKCKAIISLGSGTINYRAGAEGMVSFKINAPIRIISKSAGKDPSLWGVQVNGREGYAPKRYIRENQILVGDKNLKYVVDVVQPGTQVPILNTSENVVASPEDVSVEVTTTKPLDLLPAESKEETIVKNPVENASTEKPTLATPVLMEMVDGTQIPVLEQEVDGVVAGDLKEEDKSKQGDTQSAEDEDDDDEIGDYDDDEEDIDFEKQNDTPKMEPTTFNSVEDNEINSSDITEEENNVKELNSEITNNLTAENDKTNSLPENIKPEENNFNSESGILTPQNIENPGTGSSPPSESNLNSESGTLTPENNENQTTEGLPPSKILNEATEISSNEEIKTSENLPSSNEVNEAIKSNENEKLNEATQPSETEKLEQNISINNLPSSTPEEPQIEKEKNSEVMADKATNPELNKTETNDSTLTTTEQPINDNLKVPVEELTNKPENSQQHVPTETTKTLEEKKVEITEDLNTASVEETKPNDNISNTESLPENNTIEEVKSEENVAIVNQDSTETIEEIVSDLAEKQNTETPLEPKETQKEEQTGGWENLKTNQRTEHSFYPQPTKQSESPVVEEQTTETVTNPPKPLENQEQTTESTVNTQTDIPLQTETPSTESSTQAPPATTDNVAYQTPTTESPSPVLNNDLYQQQQPQQTDYVNPTPYNPYDDAPSNTPLPPQYEHINPDSSSSSTSPQTTDIPHYDYYDQQPTGGYAPSDYMDNEVVTESPKDSSHQHDPSSMGQGSIEPEQPLVTPEPPKMVEEEPKVLPSLRPPINDDIEPKENKGLFATIMGTVNNMLSSNKKGKHDEHVEGDELHRILFPDRDDGLHSTHKNEAEKIQFCEKLGPNGDCPHSDAKQQSTSSECDCSFTKTLFAADLTLDTFVQALSSKILEISDLIAFLSIVAAASLFFIFGYYCFCNSSREGALLSKLNQLESSLLATHKENAILKHNLMSTRQKLASIEDNSFGSNDMVVSLKKELEEELVEKARLQEQITNLQKELENAADAGIELNKIVSELLSNQTGDESIISSVEELQKQLNEQQHTILEINSSLAEKSRENSELQLLIAEQNARYESEIANLQRDNDELEQEKGNLQTRLEEIRNDFDKDITAALEGKNFEIKRLQNEIVDLSNKIEAEHTKWQTSMAKVEALEECLKNVKRDPNVNITQVIDVANIRAELLDAQRKYTTLKERLEIELDSKKLAENQLQIVTAEVEKLKQDFNQSEKDKLEAQTRLEVLSNYFKDKENQLQKELSLKEAMWLKQQGETTTTVDRLTAMQDEIQSLKSQNDSLRAEIEAQVAAHKAQTGTLENRAHETWLAARQSDRRYEEARAEATALRRKLTALAGGNINEANKPSAGPAGLGEELTNAPSPIHMESPGSPMLGRMPPPPFLPPPFMGPPPPFMGMPPPPPFVPPGEMRPAPLGRIMSPPPQRSGRFSPQHLDYDDYLDYEGNNTWHRHTYSPPPRTYRSLSPTDSRYNYGTERDLMSTYDTETDFSPPPSPRESRRRGGGPAGNGSERSSNNTRSPYSNSKKSNSGNKGALSSGSEKSYNSSSQPVGKTKGGNAGGGGKSFV